MIDLFPSRTVALELLQWQMHWYGLLYLVAFLVAWVLLPRLQRLRSLSFSKEEWANVLSWAVIGVIVGGRLGFVLFYEPAYFLAHPFEVFAVWHGGMSSHGGFLGVTLALLFALRHATWEQKLAIADIVVVPIALGLACGRIGNFINQELYGIVTALPWGIRVPGEEGLRHPTQIYAVLKDLLIALLCFVQLRARPVIVGRTFSLFLIAYGTLRFLIEYVRVQPYGVMALGPVVLTPGQLLTLPLVLAGMGLWWWTGRGARRGA